MSQFTISLEATRDLNEIFDYFCDRNIETGERFVQEFDKKCRNLVNFPMMGRSYAEVKPNLRGVPIMGYILLYQIAGNDITIVRVVNGHQDLTAQF